MSETVKAFVDWLKLHLPDQDYLAFLVVIMLEIAAFWFVEHKVTSLLVLSLTLPISLGLWYFWLKYQTRLSLFLRWTSLAGLLLLLLIWIYSAWRYRAADRARIARLMKLGQDQALALNYAEAERTFEEARSLSHDSGYVSTEASASCNLGQAQAKQGEMEKARLSLLFCIAVADENKLDELAASGHIVLGRVEALYAPYSARQDFLDALNSAQGLPGAQYMQGAANESLGDLAKNLGQLDEAYRYYQNASTLYHDAGNVQYEMGTLLGTGELKALQGRFEAARLDYDKALDYYQNTAKDRGGQSLALILLGDLEREVGSNGKARDNYLSAIGLLKEDPDTEANALSGMAELEHKLGNLEESRKDYRDALTRYQKVNDKVGEQNTFVGLCQLETMAGAFSQASDDLDEAKKVSGKNDYPLGEANALVSSADLNRERGNFDLARQLYSDALSSYKDLGAPLGEAEAWLGLGQLEVAQQRFDEAGRDFTKAWSLYEQEQVGLGEAEVQFARGDLERRLKHYSASHRFFQDALDRYDTEGGRVGKAKVLLGMGDLERELGRDANRARQYYQQARGIYQQQRSVIGEANVNLSEGKLLVKQGVAAASTLQKAYDAYIRMGMQEKADEVKGLLRLQKKS